ISGYDLGAKVGRAIRPDATRAPGWTARATFSHSERILRPMQYPLLSHKAARFTESVIRGMSVEAHRYGAVNLAQGMPDFPAPPEIEAGACRAIENDLNQ